MKLLLEALNDQMGKEAAKFQGPYMDDELGFQEHVEDFEERKVELGQEMKQFGWAIHAMEDALSELAEASKTQLPLIVGSPPFVDDEDENELKSQIVELMVESLLVIIELTRARHSGRKLIACCKRGRVNFSFKLAKKFFSICRLSTADTDILCGMSYAQL